MSRIAFSIPGEPKGKGRPRAHARLVYGDGGNGEPSAVVSMHTPADTRAAEAEALRCFRAAHPHHRPLTGPVMLRFVAVFAIPSSWPRRLREAARTGTLYCVKKPDKDNIEKLIVDALNGVAWVDDSQVMGGGLKRYGSPPRVEITIESLDDPDMPPTPGQKRLEARVDQQSAEGPPRGPRGNPIKSGLHRYPEPLRRRIDAALARDAGRKR